jgi:hypothetical protein
MSDGSHSEDRERDGVQIVDEDDNYDINASDGHEEQLANFRNMGFPNMKYMDPESHGAPV